MAYKCAACQEELSEHVVLCPHCGGACPYPNVRAAASENERAALLIRYKRAYESATIAGYSDILGKFDEATKHTVAVLSLSIDRLQSLLSGQAIITFLRQVDSSARSPKIDEFETSRPGVEHSLFPHFAEHINYASLSLDGVGIQHYGAYTVVLKTSMIERRASTLDENSLIFFRRHRVPAGSSGPSGYRSDWEDRNMVAVSKLFSKVYGCAEALFPGILLNQGDVGTDAEFVEVHVYGPITAKAVEKVVGPIPADPADKILFRRLQNMLRTLNIGFEAI